MHSAASENSADEPIAYRARIRDYYLALGYETPYRWANYADVPFTALQKPLEQCSIAIVTTAAPFVPDAGDQGPGAAYNGAAKFFSVYEMPVDDEPDLRISHIAYDRQHSPATDQNSWFPLQQLKQFAAGHRIGSVAKTFFGLPTNRSHRTTIEVDCPELVCKVSGVGADACILVANCPVCHQSVSIAARQLEAAGIPSVVMGCAKDIVEHVGVPRFVFSDFPLGNAAGLPHNEHSQVETLSLAIGLLAGAPAARTTVQSSQQWQGAPDWKLDYSNASRLSADELAARRKDFDLQKQRARSARNL
jgi:hypothetical protein